MKRLLAALTLAFVVSLALAVSAANATHSDGNGPKQDLVSGAGKNEFSEAHVDAMSGPAGEDPQGHVFIRTDIRTVVGEVTCLTVTGNRAVVIGKAVRVEPFSPPGFTFFFALFIEDNGEGNEPNDGYSFIIVGLPPGSELPPPCPEVPPFPARPMGQGNFIVHDATP